MFHPQKLPTSKVFISSSDFQYSKSQNFFNHTPPSLRNIYSGAPLSRSSGYSSVSRDHENPMYLTRFKQHRHEQPSHSSYDNVTQIHGLPNISQPRCTSLVLDPIPAASHPQTTGRVLSTLGLLSWPRHILSQSCFSVVTATLAVPPVDGHIPSVDPPHDGPDVHCLVNRLSSVLDLRTPTGGFLQGNK